MLRLSIVVLFGVSGAMSEPIEGVTPVFESQLTERGIVFEPLDDGRYELKTQAGDMKIALDNLSRQYSRNQDEATVSRFIDSILSGLTLLPTWQDSQSHVFPMLESTVVDIGDDTIRKAVTDSTRLLLVHFNEDAGIIRFLRGSDLGRWGISEDDAWKAAAATLDRVMQATEVSYIDAGDLRLGVIEANEPYKASLIRAPSLRSKVEQELGWPIYAVAPSRGIVYLLAQKDIDQIGRLGDVVLKQFKSAEYPISTEIWEIGDDDIEMVGSFPTE